MTKMRILRAGCYERVSTEEQANKGFSIKAQIDNLTEYCYKNNLKVVSHYTDEGISGTKPPMQRPELQRLLEDVKTGKIDIILFTKLDRWFRSVKEYFKVQDILDQYNVQWKAINENYDTTTANGQMAITIFLAVAQNERDKTAERIKDVLENKRKNKEACFGGHITPMGYMKIEDENGITRLVKDPETQDAMQDFWNILIESNNLNKAIRHMSTVYGIERNWKTWSRITKSDFYCGIHKGVQDFCPPYVSPDDFLTFQERKTVKNTPSGRVYLFRGMIRCPICGHKLCGDAKKSNGRTYKTYRCTNRYRSCTYASSIAEKKTEKYLLARLDEFIKGSIAEAEVSESEPKNINKTEDHIKKLKDRQRRLNVMYMAGNIEDADYLQQDAELKLQIYKLEETAPPKPRDVTPLKKLLETDFRGIYADLNEEERQGFWQRLIKEIKMDGNTVSEVIFY